MFKKTITYCNTSAFWLADILVQEQYTEWKKNNNSFLIQIKLALYNKSILNDNNR